MKVKLGKHKQPYSQTTVEVKMLDDTNNATTNYTCSDPM